MSTDDLDLGEGRWLIVENTSIESISVPHPDREADEREHIALTGFEKDTIGEEWFDHPPFVRAWEDGRLNVYRSDELPDNSLTVGRVVADLTQRNWGPGAAVTVFQICGSDPVPDELSQFIELEPTTDSRVRHGPSFMTNNWDLVRNHLPWLREILVLERRWRNRPRLIARLDTRIEQLEEMARHVI